MDEKVTAAVGAVGVADSELQEWFTAICSTYTRAAEEGKATDWSALSPALESGLLSAGMNRDAVAQLIQHLSSDGSAVDTVRAMADEGPNELVSEYRNLVAQGTGEGGDGESGADGSTNGTTGDGYDEAAWQQFLQENGKLWNGQPEAWDQFRTWFLYQAGQEGLSAPATSFITYVDSQSDKVAVFGQYGVRLPTQQSTSTTTTATDESSAMTDTSDYPELTEGATGEWVDYLDQMLKSKGF